MSILLTGGAGYIGSHTCIELLEAGYDVVMIDNYSNSQPEVLNRIRELSGKHFTFYEVDLLDETAVRGIFANHSIEAVIHFAGLKAVGESVSKPLQYYHNNITGTLILCAAMQQYGVKRLVFSSSATVYGTPEHMPITENSPLSATNPYGRSKLMIEQILQDLHVADSSWSIALLRYFNPIGAHSSGRIGENPNGIPNNLMPYISQVAVGKLAELGVYGNDYPTVDGTGVRDYIHVVDLADGHIKALNKVLSTTGIDAYNLGTGRGYSVLELVNAFEQAANCKVPYRIRDRRPGDIATCYADVNKSEQELGWKAKRDIHQMCIDTWRWQSNNPNGYDQN